LLNGKSKDEWYKMVADRVANGDGPCAPPEYAEFRGPGVHHSSEADTDMFDHDDEDQDLDHQVHKGPSSDSDDDPDSELRRQREGTPAPTASPAANNEKTSTNPTADSPSSVKTEKSEGTRESSGKAEKADAIPSPQASGTKTTPTADADHSKKE